LTNSHAPLATDRFAQSHALQEPSGAIGYADALAFMYQHNGDSPHVMQTAALMVYFWHTNPAAHTPTSHTEKVPMPQAMPVYRVVDPSQALVRVKVFETVMVVPPAEQPSALH